MWGYIFMAAVAVFRFARRPLGRSIYVSGRLAECANFPSRVKPPCIHDSGGSFSPCFRTSGGRFGGSIVKPERQVPSLSMKQ